jgi:crossover junction endonuclease MUS81
MIIKVDTREQELFRQIKNLILFIPAFKDITLLSETLPIGDIIIADDKEEKIVIERKCLQDLLSSIKDGRYEEQSYRLNGLPIHNHNIYYLIEGDVNRMNRFKDNNMEKLTMYSAMFSLNYYKGFSMMRTFSMEESAIFICNTANKLKKSDKPAYYSNTTNTIQQTRVQKQEEQTENAAENIVEEFKETTDKDYISVVKKVKKENITENNIGEIMLCQIPGVSSVTAIAIMEKFKTIPNLMKEIELSTDCLKDISYTNAKGQTRKITKTSVINIVKFLFRKEM